MLFPRKDLRVPARGILCGFLLSLLAVSGIAAKQILHRNGQVPVPCLTTMVQGLEQTAWSGGKSARSALEAIRPALPDSPERFAFMADGSRGLLPKRDGSGRNLAHRQALLQVGAVFSNLRKILVDDYGLTPPGPLTVVLDRIESGAKGYLVQAEPGSRDGAIIVLDHSAVTPLRSLARAAAHQYAHAGALAQGTRLPVAWGEAFATWAGIRRTGTPTVGDLAVLGHRRDHLQEGLNSTNLELAAGNALWFLYLDESFGPESIRLTMEELGHTAEARTALHKGVKRASGFTLDQTFRQFHVWTVLTGERSTGNHFRFGNRMDPVRFASGASSLPALSVHADPPVSPLGGAHVLLGADDKTPFTVGGLVLRFEGEMSSSWNADALLIRQDGSKQLVPIDLQPDGRGQVTLPLYGMSEVILLARNLGHDSTLAEHYTWTAHRNAAYPFELTTLDLEAVHDPGGDILVVWETETEQRLVGFNILRTPRSGGPAIRVNPIRVPAVGDLSTPSSYQYLDTTAESGVTYVYRLEGVTLDGLTNRSRGVAIKVGI
jgi:hypothetical protein